MDKQQQGLRTEQKIGLRITRQQLKFVSLLEMNAPEVDQAVEQELEENQALEAVPLAEEGSIKSTPLSSSVFRKVYNDGDDRTSEFSPTDHSQSLYDYLMLQLSEKTIPTDVRQAADYIIHSLDSNGYFRYKLSSLHNDMLFYHDLDIPEESLVEALHIVKSFDPPGVGAEDLRECLLLQLRRMPQSQTRDDALKIIEKKFEAFVKKHNHKLSSALKADPERLEEALKLIRSLNPKPGASFNSSDMDPANIIIPDFIISENEDTGEMSILLNNNVPELKISESFTEAFREVERNARGRKVKGNEYVITHYEDARNFINVLRQRQETLFNVMATIVKIQLPYFETGDVYKMRPMLIKDIAKITGYDISTISRATKNKYVSLPWGIFPLRFFFSDSIGQEGSDDVLTSRKIEAEIKKIVEGEDKRRPLSDDAIAKAMVAKGYQISRRTIAKYRNRCNIPKATLRKE